MFKAAVEAGEMTGFKDGGIRAHGVVVSGGRHQRQRLRLAFIDGLLSGFTTQECITFQRIFPPWRELKINPHMKTLFYALLAIAFFSADSFGQTVINSVPYDISAPGTYILGSDLTYTTSPSGAAIRIHSSHVTLDLGGHSIIHAGKRATTCVDVHNAGNVTIQNGSILDFYFAVSFDREEATLNSGNILQNLRLTNATWGVTLYGITGSIVRNNQMTTFTEKQGIAIDSMFGGGGNLVSGNVISGFGTGVRSDGNSYFLENMVSNCINGFTLFSSDKYRFNTTFNCTTPFIGGTALTDENN